MTDTDPMRLAQDERTDLADFLAGLTAEQWERPTLCAEWRVRDVVAHVISYDALGPLALAARFARGWFVPDQVNEVGVQRYAEMSTDELLAEFENHLRPGRLTAAFGGRIGLCDGLIHHQDIRRSLGAPRTVPRERLVEALPFARTAPPIKAARRVRGLRPLDSPARSSTAPRQGPSSWGPGPRAGGAPLVGRMVGVDRAPRSATSR